MSLSRRQFIQGSAALIGGMVLPLSVSHAAFLLGQPFNLDQLTEINDWVWFDAHGKIVIGVSQCEVGQGIYTGLPQVLADELDADWDQISVQFVTARDAYRTGAAYEDHQQFVGASMSVVKFYDRLRHAGAQARDLFLRAGADHLGVRRTQCHTHKARVLHPATGRSVAYHELLTRVTQLARNPEAPLKTASEHQYIGKNLPRIDSAAKVDGSAIFGIDLKIPDMLVGALWKVPQFTGKIIRIRNEAEIKAMPGVKALVITPTWPTPTLNTIVVVATDYWLAQQAVAKLDVEVDAGAGLAVSSASIDADNAQALNGPDGITAIDIGDAAGLWAEAVPTQRRQAQYHTPYATHATMEPCNATAHVQANGIEVWGPIQGQDYVREFLAKAFNLKHDQITVHTTFLGGSFGRKFLPDASLHAAYASKAVGKPVKVIYSREIDIQHGYYRPACSSRFSAVLDDKGYPLALQANYAGQALYGVIKPKRMQENGGWDETMVETVYDLAYRVPNLKVIASDVKQPLPLSFLRGVGSVSSVFYLESFINELAQHSQIDPLLYRLNLLAHDPLATRVLKAVGKAAKWHQKPAKNVHRGLAFQVWTGRGMAFESYVAIVVELTLKAGTVKVTKAICALDCGHPINPGLIKANIEGGIGFALSGAFKQKLHFAEGAVVESNFTDYPLLSLAEMPHVDTVILDSDRAPQGCGELSSAVVAPAVASALFSATGKHHRQMPFVLNT
ncbi:MAG: xanthine dehydrogenase family protein molybdopterin-binding subunit [Neisseriaceae bacterium]|nr:xanthine dehydrogenase family protein molybdopterin-binding subunit [Neisseriaceae bacterium]